MATKFTASLIAVVGCADIFIRKSKRAQVIFNMHIPSGAAFKARNFAMFACADISKFESQLVPAISLCLDYAAEF